MTASLKQKDCTNRSESYREDGVYKDKKFQKL